MKIPSSCPRIALSIWQKTMVRDFTIILTHGMTIGGNLKTVWAKKRK